jgi:hypothetical protein
VVAVLGAPDLAGVFLAPGYADLGIAENTSPVPAGAGGFVQRPNIS